jgi:Serpentine type 7TM GPCR chemoreceptor Str
MRREFLTINSTMKSTNRQLTAVLAVQAATPLLLEIVPSLFLDAFSLSGDNHATTASSGGAGAIMTVFVNWRPMINGAATLLIIKPYRRAIAEWLRKLCGMQPKPTATVVSPMQVTSLSVSQVHTLPSLRTC